MANEDPTVTINVFANTDVATKALNSVGNTVSVLGGKAKSVTSNLNSAGKAITGLGNKASVATSKTNKFKASTTKATSSISGLSTNTQNASNRTKALNTNLTRGSASTKSMTKSVIGLGAAYLSLRGAMSAMRGLITVSMNFEDTMAQVKAVSEQNAGFTIGSFKAMEAEARRLGSTTRFTASQAAEGLKFLSMAGFTAEQSMASLESTLQLAQAGNMELGRSADIVSNIMSAFGAEANESGRFVDILAKTASTSNNNIEELGEAMKFVAPIASGLGQSVEDTASAMGVLGNRGIKAGMAGAGLRMVLSQLTDSNSSAVKTLKGMGVEYDKINPKTNDLITVFSNLKDAGVDVEAVFAAFDARAANVAQVLTTHSSELTKYSKRIQNSEGAVEQMAHTMDNTFKGSALGALSAFQDMSIGISNGGLKDVFRNLAIEAKKMFNDFVSSGKAEELGKDLATGFQALVNTVKLVGGVVSTVVEKLGGISSAVVKLSSLFLYLKITGSSAFKNISNSVLKANLVTAAYRGTLFTLGKAYSAVKTAGVFAFVAVARKGKGSITALKNSFKSLNITSNLTWANMKTKGLSALKSLTVAGKSAGKAIGKSLGGVLMMFSTELAGLLTKAFTGGHDLESASNLLDKAKQSLNAVDDNTDFLEATKKSLKEIQDEEGLSNVVKSMEDEIKSLNKQKLNIEVGTGKGAKEAAQHLENTIDRSISRINRLIDSAQKNTVSFDIGVASNYKKDIMRDLSKSVGKSGKSFDITNDEDMLALYEKIVDRFSVAKKRFDYVRKNEVDGDTFIQAKKDFLALKSLKDAYDQNGKAIMMVSRAEKARAEALEKSRKEQRLLTDEMIKNSKAALDSIKSVSDQLKDDKISKLDDDQEIKVRLKFFNVDTLGSLSKKISSLQSKALTNDITKDEVSDLEVMLKEYVKIKKLKEGIADTNLEGANAEKDVARELNMLDAKLSGNKELISSLEREHAIRQKTAELEQSGVESARAKALATKLITKQENLKDKEDSPNVDSKASPSAVSSLQTIGGGGGFSLDGSLEGDASRTAKATEKIAQNTQSLTSVTPQKSADLVGKPNANTAEVGSASQSQRQSNTLRSILDVLKQIRDSSSGDGLIKIS